MSTHSCPVVPVVLEKHPNADSLSICKIKGFTYVARTEDWVNNPLGVWIEPDMVVPSNRPEFAWLAKSHKEIENNGIKGYRIKVKRLRGIMSMGLMTPAPEGAKVGDNLMEHFGIVRYEPPISLSTFGEATKPPPGVRYSYDVESAYNFAHLFTDNEEVVATEKVHGCLQYATTITMVDGSRKRIGEIVNGNNIGLYVLGMDENGKVIPAKILNVFKNGKADKWLKITGNRRGIGRGSSYFAVYATPNHQFYIKNNYVEAKDLKKGDIVTSLRSDLGLTPLQEQVILGKLLGDGSLYIQMHNAARLGFSHKKDHEDYVDWTLKGLGELGNNHKGETTSGFGTEMVRAGTFTNFFIHEKFSSFIKDERKIIPEWVADELTPIALAFTYMDDGYLNHDGGQEDRAGFRLCDFTEEECSIFQRGMKKLGIQSSYNVYDGYSRIDLNSDNAEKLFLMVAPYIPPVMQYKLPERYRGHMGWLPTVKNNYKQWLVEQEIESIEECMEFRSNIKFDIETETHNFFANNILVHNSNARFAYVPEIGMFCGSRTEWKRQNDGNLWWKALASHPEVEEFCKNNPDITVYGEAYGQVQDLRYNFPKGQVGIVVFDLLRNGEWISHEEAREIGKNLPWVPILYHGPWHKEELFALADGNSEVAKWKDGPSQIREGIVIKPVKERSNLEIGRTQLKIVSNAYLERA